MFISEIFYSLQGEGELSGVPSVFVRTSGCNLRCNWCDTMYTSWDPVGIEMSLDEILARVDSFSAQHCVLTGGEPMLANGIHALASALRERGKHITIETAGTIKPEGIACDLASLSPKLSNSSPDQRLPDSWRLKHDKLRWQLSVIQQWIEHYPYQLKFVISSAGDVDEMASLLDDLKVRIPPAKILLMPEGTSSETLRKREEALTEICLRHGYRYCNRLHIQLFGNKRGT